MKRNLLTALLGLALAGLLSKANAETAGSTRLRALEAEFMKASAERGFDGFMSYFADDASDLPNGGAIVTGKENIRKALGPGDRTSLTWRPVNAEMAASGESVTPSGTMRSKPRTKTAIWLGVMENNRVEELEGQQLESSDRHGQRRRGQQRKALTADGAQKSGAFSVSTSATNLSFSASFRQLAECPVRLLRPHVLFPEVIQDGFCLGARDHRGKRG